MATIERIMFTILLFVTYCSILACGHNSKDRSAHSYNPFKMLPPRPGKRSLRLADDNYSKATLLRLLEAAENLRFYYDQLPFELQSDVGQDKIIFTPKLGRAIDGRMLNEVHYTPRLGRRKINQALPTATEEESQDQMADASPSYFSPRLGRNYYSPLLGRELSSYYDLYPSVRVSRSVNNSKTN